MEELIQMMILQELLILEEEVVLLHGQVLVGDMLEVLGVQVLLF